MMAKAAANLKRGSRKKQQAQPQQAQPSQPPTGPTQQSKPRQTAAPQGSASPQKNHPREAARDNRHPQRPMAADPRQQRQPQKPQPQNGTPPVQRPNPPGREPTPEIQSLTSKNYRLAKELSELRVRHRDECKNVTRLTMENMNLASRCREAITHVAMLKKELAMHQKRAKEALALQRQQTQRMANNLSVEVSRVLSQSFSQDSEDANSPNRSKTEMERVLSSIEPPPPPPPKPTLVSVKPVAVSPKNTNPPKPSTPKLETNTNSYDSFAEASVDEEEESLGSDIPRDAGRSVLDIVESLSDMSSPPPKLSPSDKDKSPKVYSTPNNRPKEDRWTPTIDATPGSDTVADSSSLFPHSASPKLGNTYRPRKYDDEFPSDIVPQQTPTRVRVNLASTIVVPDDEDEKTDGTESDGSPPGAPDPYLRDEGVIKMNSISAFDASFDNPFPSNFAVSESSPKKRSNKSVEIYNPFAPSPTKAIETEMSEEFSFGTPPQKDEKRSGRGWKGDNEYSTPPKGGRSNEVSPYGEPSRPHKTGASAARARYEKALQPRNGSATNESQSTATGSSGSQVGPTDASPQDGFQGSPSRLLQRIQQKRKNKEQPRHESGSNIPTEFFPENVEPATANARDANGFPVTSEKTSAKKERGHFPFDNATKTNKMTSEKPFDELEEEPFDVKPVGPKSARLQEIKGRRTVRQPVSYAEPALNTKIRQGHTFFPKNDEDFASKKIETALYPI